MATNFTLALVTIAGLLAAAAFCVSLMDVETMGRPLE
jgi:hypothetical protein